MDAVFCVIFLFVPSNLVAFLVQHVRSNVLESKMKEMEDWSETADPEHEWHVQSHSR